jgi:hypothetical protein
VLRDTAGVTLHIDIPAGVLVRDGKKRLPAAALHVGAFLQAHGYAEPRGDIRGIDLRVDHPALDLPATVVSTNGGVIIKTSTGDTFRLRISGSTELSSLYGSIPITVSDIPQGVKVHLQGVVSSDGTVAVRRLVVRLRSVTLRGSLVQMGSSQLTLQNGTGTSRIRFSSGVQVAQGSRFIELTDLVVGDDITVCGYTGAQAVLARKILVHRKLVGLDGTVAEAAPDGFSLTTSAGPVRVVVSSTTQVSGISQTIATGLKAHVTGYRRGDGVVLATRVRLSAPRQ